MFLMFIGLTLIESAQTRMKSRNFVVTKNILLITLSCVLFFIIGYAFAFGESSAGVVGAQSNYVGVFQSNNQYHERQFPYYFATSLVVTCLATGSLAERVRIEPIIGFLFVQQIIIYPFMLCWAWNLQGGWLRALGFFDRGGSVVIFMTGAISGIIGTLVLGPRYGRFIKKAEASQMKAAQQKSKTLPAQLEEELAYAVEVDELFLRKVRKLISKETQDSDFYTISVPMMVLGTFLTTIGWAMLNASGSGSHSLNSQQSRKAAELAYLNTFLSGSACALISFLLKRHIVRGDHKRTPRYDVRSLCNGFLSGIAAVSAGSGIMPPWGAVCTGLIQSLFYMVSCYIFKQVKFDDPMENFQVYGTAAFWAMIASIFFWPDSGILWGGKDSGSLLGIQLLGFATIGVWTVIVAWLYFFSLKRCRVLKLTKA